MMYAQDEMYLICHNLVLKELKEKTSDADHSWVL